MTEPERILALCHNARYGNYSAEEFKSRLETFLVSDRNIKLQKEIDDISECLEWDIHTLPPDEQNKNFNDYINRLLGCINCSEKQNYPQ